MRIVLISLVVFLVACNGSSNSVSGGSPTITQADIQAAIAPLKAQIQSLQADNKKLKEGQAKLTLIGKVHGVATEERTLAIGRAAVTTPDFGPCTDMGVLVSNPGFTTAYQGFRQCTGYYYEAQVGTGNIGVASRIFWDGPNCTGNMYEWEAGGAGYNTQILQGGIVFISPVDGVTDLSVTAGQTPQPIMIQSAWVASNPGCQSDIETQLLYHVIPNNTRVTGVPNSVGANFQLAAP